MFKRMIVLLLIGGVLIEGPLIVWGAGSPLSWDTPYGNFNLDLTTTEALLGYDAVLKQAIAGMSVPVYSDPKGIVTLELGAVAPWPTNNAAVEPYLSLGHDIAKEIPGLNQYQSLHLNIFGRYATSEGKAGVGLSFSYSFAASPSPTPPPATTTSTAPEPPTGNP